MLVLVGLPLAFSSAMLLLLIRSHAIGPVLGPSLIVALVGFFVAVVRWAHHLEPPEDPSR